MVNAELAQLVQVGDFALEEGEDVVCEDDGICVRAVGVGAIGEGEHGKRWGGAVRRARDAHGFKGADEPGLESGGVDSDEHLNACGETAHKPS